MNRAAHLHGAFETVTRHGHALNGWRFQYDMAGALCRHCDATVLVNLIDGTVHGPAACFDCRNGGAVVQNVAPSPEPPAGIAMEIPCEIQPVVQAVPQRTRGITLAERVGVRETADALF